MWWSVANDLKRSDDFIERLKKNLTESRIKPLRQKIVTLFPNPANSQSLLLCEKRIFEKYFLLQQKRILSRFLRLPKISAHSLLKNRKDHKCKSAPTILAKCAELFKICSKSKYKNPRNSKFRGTFYFGFSEISRQKNCINYVKFAGNRLCNLQTSKKINFGTFPKLFGSERCQKSERDLIKTKILPNLAEE